MTRNPITTALLVTVTTFVFVILYGPILVPIASSFFADNHGVIDWSKPSLGAYASLLKNQSVLAALRNTVLVGFAAVFASLCFGTLLAFYYNSRKTLSREILQFVIFLPFLMPPIITGLSLLIFFREIEFERSLVTVIIGHTVFVLALVYRTIFIRLQSLSHSMAEASYDLGASGLQTFRYILLPNLKSAILAAGVLAFALSFDETMITILVTGTQNTLPIRLWAMMRLGFSPDINALVAGILVFTTALCLITIRFLMPREATSARG